MRREAIRLATRVTLNVALAGDPAAPPLLLLHGVTDSSFTWSRVLPALAARFRVIAPDQRGHGDSERPGGGYRPSELASDALALLDALGIERARIAGHSLGTFVAQHLAGFAPGRVERLALIGGGPTLGIPAVRELTAALDGFGETVPLEFIREFQESTVALPVPAEFMDQVVAESAKLPARVWRALFAGMLAEPESPDLAKLELTLLVAGGEKDAIFPGDVQRALADRQRATRLQLWPDVGHTPQWERPDELARSLLGFF
jgi:pimeloyl-ACP methyl ester carboxylesterase